MKLLYARDAGHEKASLPVRGAWVEILLAAVISSALPLSLPVRGAWVEIPASQVA